MKQNYYYLLFFGIVFLIYGQTISFDFSHFDDDLIIIKNEEFFTKEATIKDIFTTDAFVTKDGNPFTKVFYRPLQNLTFLVEARLVGGAKPWIFHLNNILLFALFGCALFYFIQQFNISPKLAFLGTLFYLAHPLFTLPAAWIPARGDIMLALFSILAMISFMKFVKENRFVHLILTLSWFSLALFSKETAAVLPFIFLLYFYLINNNYKINFKHILLGIMMLAIGIFWFYLRQNATEMNQNATNISNFFYGFQTIPTAISQFFIPFEFSPIPLFSPAKTTLGIILFAVIIFIIITNKKLNKKLILFWGVWLLIFLIPTFFFRGMDVDYLDHRFLIPLVGVLIILLSLLSSKFSSNNKNTNKMLPLGLGYSYLLISIIVIFSCISFVKAQAYNSQANFYDTVIQHNDKSAVIFFNRGKMYEKNGNIKGALKDFDKAISLNPFFVYYAERGLLRAKTGRIQEAVNDFNKAEELFIYGSLAANYVNRGFAYYKLGYFDKSIHDYEQVLALGQSTIDERTNALLGKSFSYFAMQQYQKCIEMCEELLKFSPENASAIQQRAKALKML